MSVFSKDLREAAEVGSGTNIVGNYELHDLVQLEWVSLLFRKIALMLNPPPKSVQTVGVIFKTERDTFRVLDQNGQVRLVQPHQISMRRDSSRAIATDSEGHELRVNDNVKEVDGEVSFVTPACIIMLHFVHFIGSKRVGIAYSSILFRIFAQPRYRGEWWRICHSRTFPGVPCTQRQRLETWS